MGEAALALVKRTGRVASGAGIAASVFDEAREDLTAYFGVPPHTGTLNLLLRWPLLLCPETAIAFPESPILRQHGAWPVSLLGQPCLLMRWGWCPLHIAEIVSPVGFRAAHGLADGDAVSLELDEALVAPLSPRNVIAWAAMWGLRRKAYLDKDYVQTLMDSNPRAYKLAGQPVLQRAVTALPVAPQRSATVKEKPR
jgi:hypothetical protein